MVGTGDLAEEQADLLTTLLRMARGSRPAVDMTQTGHFAHQELGFAPAV